jgi:hypothetical protein
MFQSDWTQDFYIIIESNLIKKNEVESRRGLSKDLPSSIRALSIELSIDVVNDLPFNGPIYIILL